jgi:uncharacterized protein YbjT (DUF2867 family)
MSETSKIAVAGATGRVGRHVVEILEAEGHEVVAISRSVVRNLSTYGERAAVRRLVVVSIIGADRFAGGYGAAKVAHERAALEGPIPALILRAAQFHEFVEQLVDWGRQQDGSSQVPRMRTQLVAARAVAEELAAMATDGATPAAGESIREIAGPREERLVEMASLLAERRGDQAGPRYESWLAAS